MNCHPKILPPGTQLVSGTLSPCVQLIGVGCCLPEYRTLWCSYTSTQPCFWNRQAASDTNVANYGWQPWREQDSPLVLGKANHLFSSSVCRTKRWSVKRKFLPFWPNFASTQFLWPCRLESAGLGENKAHLRTRKKFFPVAWHGTKRVRIDTNIHAKWHHRPGCLFAKTPSRIWIRWMEGFASFTEYAKHHHDRSETIQLWTNTNVWTNTKANRKW